jgi:hypothetical protein
MIVATEITEGIEDADLRDLCDLCGYFDSLWRAMAMA